MSEGAPTPATRGNLKPARIEEVANAKNAVVCMFNPHEYKISKSNSFDEQDLAQSQPSPTAELKQSGAQTLSLKLYFDTYESGEDVSLATRELWEFMKPRGEIKAHKGNKETGEKDRKADKGKVPQVSFKWGVFSFDSFITQMSQNFTLFRKDGTPVRAVVDITFKQYADVDDYDGIKGDLAPSVQETKKVVHITAGDRVDQIAHEQYGDASKWREVAEHNKLDDPSKLRPGMKLALPARF